MAVKLADRWVARSVLMWAVLWVAQMVSSSVDQLAVSKAAYSAVQKDMLMADMMVGSKVAHLADDLAAQMAVHWVAKWAV